MLSRVFNHLFQMAKDSKICIEILVNVVVKAIH